MDHWNTKGMNYMGQSKFDWPVNEFSYQLPETFPSMPSFGKPLYEGRNTHSNSFLPDERNGSAYPIGSYLHREAQLPKSTIWPPPPGFEQSPVQPKGYNAFNSPNFHDVFTNSYSLTPSPAKPRPLYNCDASCQTEPLNAQMGKLVLRETILTGCEEIKSLFNFVPNSNLKEYTEALKENLLESLTTNSCSSLMAGSTEQKTLCEYGKSFIRISEAWLGTRNCFGLSDRCGRLCHLETRDLSVTYTAWMEATQRLLDVMLQGLQKVSMMYTTDSSLNDNGSETGSTFEEVSDFPGYFLKDKKLGEIGHPVPKLPTKSPRKYAGQSCPLLPIPPQAYVNVPPLSSSEYMKPSSYNIPRKELTPSKKAANINQAKAKLCPPMCSPRAGIYVMGLPVVSEPKGIEGDTMERTPKKIQIAMRKKEKETFKKSSKSGNNGQFTPKSSRTSCSSLEDCTQEFAAEFQ